MIRSVYLVSLQGQLFSLRCLTASQKGTVSAASVRSGFVAVELAV